jgi:anti-sigma factor RsiW
MHLRAQRRLGAYFDGVLGETEARVMAAHVAECARCSQEIDQLRRLRPLLEGALPAPPPPDWTGFWAGVVRGIEADRHASPLVRPAWRRWITQPRVIYGGAVILALLSVLTVWQVFYAPIAPEAAVVVRSARTDLPGGVMVYASPEQDFSVVWVFDEE